VSFPKLAKSSPETCWRHYRTPKGRYTWMPKLSSKQHLCCPKGKKKCGDSKNHPITTSRLPQRVLMGGTKCNLRTTLGQPQIVPNNQPYVDSETSFACPLFQTQEPTILFARWTRELNLTPPLWLKPPMLPQCPIVVVPTWSPPCVSFSCERACHSPHFEKVNVLVNI